MRGAAINLLSEEARCVRTGIRWWMAAGCFREEENEALLSSKVRYIDESKRLLNDSGKRLLTCLITLNKLKDLASILVWQLGLAPITMAQVFR